jgi:hypothetical protein
MLLVVIIYRHEIGRDWWIYFVSIGAISLAFFLPWLLKNGLATRNPVFPHLWATEWVGKDRLEYYQGSVDVTPLNQHDLILPLSLTWFGVEGAEIRGIERYYADVGPLLLIFSIPGLIAKRKDRRAQVVMIWLGIGWLSMVIGGRITPLLWQTRYYYSLLPAAALAVGWGWESVRHIASARIRLSRIAGGIVIVVLVFSVWQSVNNLIRQNPLSTILGIRSRDEYLDEMLGYYAPAMRAMNDLPMDSKALLLWEERALYAPINAEADELIDNWYVMRQSIGEPDAILHYIKAQGITHILIYRSGAQFERENRIALTNEDWDALNEMIASLSKPVKFGEIYELYSVD